MATAIIVAAILLAAAFAVRLARKPQAPAVAEPEPTETDACYDMRPTVIYGPLRDGSEL